MAMRWSLFNVGLVIATACVTTTTRTFLPSPQNPIYRPQQAVPIMAEYTRLQCPAMRKAQQPDAGRVRLIVDVDTTGLAARALLTGTTGDDVLDGVLGTVAAQLAFPRDSTAKRVKQRTVIVDFRCAGDSAIVKIETPD